jgi:hypothetical protein
MEPHIKGGDGARSHRPPPLPVAEQDVQERNIDAEFFSRTRAPGPASIVNLSEGDVSPPWARVE